MTVAKTDNSDLDAKLALRRYFLRKYHAGNPPSVLDCCQGDGIIWKHLREEFPLRSYWGIDVKRKKGRLKLDSVRVIQQPGWTEHIVDVDTYGSPWRHWTALLPNVRKPTTVFLTAGLVRVGGGGGLDRVTLRALGLQTLRVPEGIAGRLHEIALRYLLTICYDYKITLVEATEALSGGNARYIGLRLSPDQEQTEEAGVTGLEGSQGRRDVSHGREVENQLDRCHVQSLDGVREGGPGMRTLLRRNADHQPHGPPGALGPESAKTGHLRSELEKADRVERPGRTGGAAH